MPDNAVVRGFTFQGPGAEPSARLLPRDEGRETYDRIVAQARDPALLEFAGFNLVRSSVFPVEPGGTQAVRLTYEHILPANGDRVDYVLPRSESVEYNVAWKIAVKITSATPIAAIYSPSHRLRTSRPKPTVGAVELADDAGTAPGPFRLSFLRERADVSASLFAYPDPKVGGGYFLLLAGLPTRSTKPEPAALRREVTLVIDRSGSMRGEKLAQVREAALQVLAGLDDGEAFNVILYNEGVEPFAERPVRKSPATIKSATEFLKGMTARGGTNIHDALLDALRQPPAEGTLPIVLFMTDGLPTVGQTSEAAIRELARKGNPHQRRIFTFGVGVDVNTPLLEKIAYESRATTTFILPSEDVEVKVADVFKRLRGPVLADPILSVGETGDAPAHPGADPQPDSRRLRRRSNRLARPVPRRATAGVHPPRELPRDASRISVSPPGRPGDNPQWLRPPALGGSQDWPPGRRDPRTRRHSGRRVPRSQGEHQPGDPRARGRDRAALDRVRHPHRIHRLPGPRRDRLLAKGQGPFRGREPVPQPSDPDP